MKRFTVIGLGNFGFYAAKALYEDGNEVIAVDMDKEPRAGSGCALHRSDLHGGHGQGKIKTLGLETMDGVIVSTGTKISVSILICLHLHEMGVKKILAKALDDDHAKILKKVGATKIIHPERDVALRTPSLPRPCNMIAPRVVRVCACTCSGITASACNRERTGTDCASFSCVNSLSQLGA